MLLRLSSSRTMIWSAVQSIERSRADKRSVSYTSQMVPVIAFYNTPMERCALCRRPSNDELRLAGPDIYPRDRDPPAEAAVGQFECGQAHTVRIGLEGASNSDRIESGLGAASGERVSSSLAGWSETRKLASAFANRMGGRRARA